MKALAEWNNFYVIVGSSAGALIGLQFVVMTLIADKQSAPSEALGSALATPTIVHFGAVLLLSALVSAPCNIRRRKAMFTQPTDVPGWRTPEEVAVISTELRSAQIPYLPTRSSRARHRGQHETPRLLQAKRLLILQGSHRGDGLEVLVEGGNAHNKES